MLSVWEKEVEMLSGENIRTNIETLFCEKIV